MLSRIRPYFFVVRGIIFHLTNCYLALTITLFQLLWITQMKAYLLAFAVASSLAVTPLVSAEELPKADLETIIEFVDYCKMLAEEDGIQQAEMDKFLLKCVNEELVAEGYQKISKLPAKLLDE